MKRLMMAAMMAALHLAAGCGGDETGPDEHVPHSAKLFGPTGTELTPDIESDHYASLTFAPGTPGTVRAVAGKRFTLDVTTQNAAGTGSVTVGFGHDVQADEASFGPFAVTVR